MTTYDRKVCMLGAAEVGKTSLVRRFVDGMFSDRYLGTIGVKIDRRPVAVGADRVNLVLWDIEGETARRRPPLRYLRGASGYLLVVDGTRRATLAVAKALHSRVAEVVPDLPFLLLLNKHDLRGQWDIDTDEVARLNSAGWTVQVTSALTGDGVEAAFERLAVAALAVGDGG